MTPHSPFDTDVLICGAGPTGLMLACQLARHGVPFLLIDKNAGPSVTSKAMVVQARRLEFYDQLGIAATAVERGQIASGAVFHINGGRDAQRQCSAAPARRPLLLKLGRCKPDFADIAEIYALPGLPQIMAVLHGRPTLRRTAKSFGKTQRHFGADAIGARENAIQCRRSNAELCG